MVAPFVPLVEHTPGVLLVNCTASAAPAALVPVVVALTVKVGSPYVFVPTEDVEKVIVCVALVIVNDRSTTVAGL